MLDPQVVADELVAELAMGMRQAADCPYKSKGSSFRAAWTGRARSAEGRVFSMSTVVGATTQEIRELTFRDTPEELLYTRTIRPRDSKVGHLVEMAVNKSTGAIYLAHGPVSQG